ncbi:MAG TPA: hypothetical protein VKI23_03950 [Cellulomonadaceae bacterium]|nr:hypothetical protein [Cellulomonadaceae bacterium]
MTTDPDQMYTSPVLAAIGWLIVGIPAAALIAVVYWTGTWLGGGLLGGALSVLSTGALVWFMWKRRLGRRR